MDCQEKILSNDYLDLITDYLLPPQYNYDLPIDYCFHVVEGELGILYLNRRELALAGISDVNYTFMPKVYGLSQMEMNDFEGKDVDNRVAFLDAGILQVREEPLNLTGRNVIIGFIDTGIDYRKQVFRNEYGETRILGIWDQTIQSGNPPEGFAFGSEYTKVDMNEALRTDNPLKVVPSTDQNGHGTAMASIALGKEPQIGVAPDAEIAVVKLKEAKPYLKNYYYIEDNVPCFQENDIILAIQYLQKFARTLYRPLVICLGIGTNLGDHTGNTLLDRYMDNIAAQKSRAIVVACGNEGNHAHHYRGKLEPEKTKDEVEIRVSENCKGFTLDFWGKLPYEFALSLKSPSGEQVQMTQITGVRRRLAQPIEYYFVFGSTRLFVESYLIEQYAGAQLIRMRFERPIKGIWVLQVENKQNYADGLFDLWLPLREFLSADVQFLRADPNITMTEPAYGQNVISVGAYSLETQGIWQNSGRGFGRTGAMKPDLAAPGQNISTILGKRSGTSMACAITAGAVALFFQWAVVEQNEIFADSSLIRNYLIRGAQRQSNRIYPNEQWGYGKINLEGIFRFIAGV